MIPSVKENTCSAVENRNDIEKVEDLDEKVIMQKENRVIIDKEQALKVAKGMEDPSNEYVEPGDLLICETDMPEDGDKKYRYHSTPSGSRESIEKVNGLMPTRVEDCPNKQGVFVTESKSSAKSWAEVLGAERNIDKFEIFEIKIPEKVREERDTNPINRGDVPESKVICTDVGIPAKMVETVETVEVDPADESKMGGFR